MKEKENKSKNKGPNGVATYEAKCRRRQMKTLISIIAVLVAVGCSNEIQMVEDANTMLQAEIEKSKSAIKKLKVANAKLNQQLVDSRAENVKLKADVIKFAIELKPRFTDVTTELEKLKKEIEQLKLDNNNLKEKRGKQEDK